MADALTSESYPSGRVVTACYDAANRVSQVGGATCSNATGAYASNFLYASHGAPTQYAMGNNIWHEPSYNSRLQMSGFSELVNNSSAAALLTASMNWGSSNNNGNLQGATYIHGGPSANNGGISYATPLTFTQSYVYDGVNRLNTITETGNYSRSFAYDPYGNMFVSYASASLPPAGNTPTSYVYNSNNQFTSGSYDQAGNATSVNGNTIGYDFEGRQTSVVGAGVNETYVYDGDGRRVGKYVNSGSPTSVFVYDALGRMAAEYSTYVDTPSCVTCYLSPDHLGTARLITDQKGNVVSRHDYLPFGEEIGNATGRNAQWSPVNDSINQKFTGKERDSESGLDYFGARYYGSAPGRFTSPDKPLLDQFPENPQSWNLYAYGRNNPLNGTDPSGESWSEFWQAFGNCFRYGSCHTTDHIADQRENGFLSSLQVDGKYLSPSQQEDLKARLFGDLSSANAIRKVDALNGAIPHVQQNDDTGVPPLPGQLGQPAQRARYEDPGHHDPSSPNYIRGKSPIPDDAADVYNNAIRRGDPKPGEGEVYYGKNANGEYYRYSGQNGTVHWSGSVLKEQVPNWISEGAQLD